MRILLLLSALVMPPSEPAATLGVSAAARISVRADTDSVVTANIMSDVAAAMAAVAQRNGFDQTASPAGWLEPSYLAAASTRPDVAEYFSHYSAYATDVEAHIDSMVAEIAQRRFHEAGYDAKMEADLYAAFMRGYDRSRERQHLLYAAMRRQSNIALRLHEFLVKVDARVGINPKDNTLAFQKPLEHRRYNELAIAIDAANEDVKQLSGQAQTTVSSTP